MDQQLLTNQNPLMYYPASGGMADARPVGRFSSPSSINKI
jgi:hypothetical protein